MRRLKTAMAIAAITLCVAACNKNGAANNAADENAMNAADMNATVNATDMNATDMNATDMNAAADNNMAVPTDNGDRTDTGPRPTSTTTG